MYTNLEAAVLQMLKKIKHEKNNKSNGKYWSLDRLCSVEKSITGKTSFFFS